MSKGPWLKPICKCGRCLTCKLREYQAAARERRKDSDPEAQRDYARIDAMIAQENAAQ